MYLVCFLNGFGYGVVLIVINIIVIVYILVDKRGEGINFYGLLISLVVVIGFFVGIFMLDNFYINFKMVIVLCSILIVIVVLGVFVFLVKNIILNLE